MCECNGTKIMHVEIMKGVWVVQPCPNCTSEIHKHYEQELERRLTYGKQKLV